MKHFIIPAILLSSLLVTSCFEDEGNYSYKHQEAPIWKIKDTENININCRVGEGEKVTFNGGDYYTWATDSLTRAAEVRYEWKINGVVFATEPTVTMATDDFIKKAKIKSFGTSGIFGSFSIIEKETDVVYMASVMVKISQEHDAGDWFILSENQGNSKLSFMKRDVYKDGEVYKLRYELKNDYYQSVNGEVLQGNPISMAQTYGAQDISNKGSLTVLTDKVSCEINPITFLRTRDLKDDFSGVTPENLDVVDRQDAWGGLEGNGGLHSYIATKDGRIFKKMMTKNNLGGNFVSSPYEVDGKGCKVTRFGSTLIGYSCIPCYDEKNRRVLAALFFQSGETEEMFPGGPSFPAGTQFQVSKIYPVKQPAMAVPNVPAVENMPADTEVLGMGVSGSDYVGGFFGGVSYTYIGMVYNTGGKTYFGKFGIVSDNSNPGVLGNLSKNTNIEFPGGILDNSSVILFSGYANKQSYPKELNNYMLYSKGSHIYCLDISDNFAQKFDIALEDESDKVTCMKWSVEFNTYYEQLIVGTEKGKVYCFTAVNTLKPVLLQTFDMGGKVVDVKELYSYSDAPGRDNY